MIVKQASKVRHNCEAVLNFDESVDTLNLLIDELKKSSIRGIGLAAPQIGIFKQIAIVVVKDPILLINADYEPLDPTCEKIVSKEGCLSLPGIKAEVLRFPKVKIINNLSEKHNNIELDGLEAICVQHEIDHLKGKLMIDVAKVVHNIGDNEPCPCGNKIDNKFVKYKKCCKKLVLK